MQTRLLGALLIVVAALAAPSVAAADGALVARIDLGGTVEVHNCTQEPLLLRGQILVISHELVDASGASHSVFQFVFQGVKATSLLTGVEYVLTGSTTEVLRAGESGALVLSSRGSRLQLAHGQEGVDFMHQVVVHFTVTPEGTPTATFERGRFECQGHAA
jgi:hypothetical protein